MFTMGLAISSNLKFVTILRKVNVFYKTPITASTPFAHTPNIKWIECFILLVWASSVEFRRIKQLSNSMKELFSKWHLINMIALTNSVMWDVNLSNKSISFVPFHFWNSFIIFCRVYVSFWMGCNLSNLD